MTIRSRSRPSIRTRSRLWLDSSLVNLDRPITIEPDGGRRQVIKAKANPETFCVGLEERGDPRLAAPARVSVKLRP